LETYHKRTRAQIRPSKHNRNKSKRKDNSAHHPYKPSRIRLIPFRRIRAKQNSTRKRQQTASHERGKEDFVDSHVGLADTSAGA